MNELRERANDKTDSAFEALLARSGDAVVVVDDRLRIVRAGPTAGQLAERPAAELTGMSVIAGFGSAPLDSIAREALASSRPASGETQLGHLGARTFRVDALPTSSGGLVLTLRDVTELRRMERVRRDFVANISHELRTPLASIKLLAETRSGGATDDPDSARDMAVQIEREVDHLAQLVDELLDLSRIESGETKLNIRAVDAAEVVSAIIDRMRALAERRRVRLRGVTDAAGQPAAAADRARLTQALINLTHNAIKFSRPGGEVRIGWQERGARIRFVVADDGVGIPASHLPRIFERFYKVDRSRTRHGEGDGGSAGLGLAIVRHIVEAHGGTVGVESDEGVGSTFWIEVPRQPPTTE